MLGFQAAGAAPIFMDRVIPTPETAASAIRIGNPASWGPAKSAIKESGGAIDIVTDDEIFAAQSWLAANEGVFAEPASAGWLRAGAAADIPEGQARIVTPEAGERIAIFRHQGRLSAVVNVCAHQNGPLGEGRIIDGCITCPWHGFQFRPEDGCAPPPFTEKIATYRLRLEGNRVLIDPHPNPPGTYVERSVAENIEAQRNWISS